MYSDRLAKRKSWILWLLLILLLIAALILIWYFSSCQGGGNPCPAPCGQGGNGAMTF